MSFYASAQNEDDKTYTTVEEMPVFPGCERYPSKESQKFCTTERLMRYVYENLTYPDQAKEKGVTGQVITEFVIEKDGSIKNIRILKGIGGGCDEAALKVIASMNRMGQRWTPGKNEGKTVRVLYQLPIEFLAVDDDTSSDGEG